MHLRHEATSMTASKDVTPTNPQTAVITSADLPSSFFGNNYRFTGSCGDKVQEVPHTLPPFLPNAIICASFKYDVKTRKLTWHVFHQLYTYSREGAGRGGRGIGLATPGIWIQSSLTTSV